MNKRYPYNILLSLSILILILSGFAKVNKTLNSPQSTQDELYKKIETYNEEHKVAPIDAKVDRVWKAIPGYNGKEVDIEASYKVMKETGEFHESKVIYRETNPKVHLEDLGPEPIYRGNPEKPMVTFLINVAWGNEYIPEILRVLEKYQINTTFFFDGSWLEKNPDLAKKIKGAGHEIGNHAYSHPDLNQSSRAQTVEELQKTNDIIEKSLGVKVKWFAPPSGSFNATTLEVAHELGMKTILWTADTVDWKKPETSEMVRRVVAKVEKGSMVLMHPTKPTAEGLETMIKEVKAKGYELGTVSDLMSEKRIH